VRRSNKSSHVRRRLIEIGALACLVVSGLPVVARAGEVYAPPPPSPTKVVDVNNVNLISGSPSLQMPTISSAGLSEAVGNIGVTWRGWLTDYSDSFVGYIASRDTNPAASNEGGDAAIVIGGRTFQLGVDIFAGTCAGSICTYWDKEGVAYLFDTSKRSDPFDGIAKKLGMLVQINKPDGETIQITLVQSTSVFTTPGGYNHEGYTVHVVVGYYPSVVTSSNGWVVKYEYTKKSYTFSTGSNTFYAYVPQKIYIINTSIDYCDPAAASCNSSNAAHWPTFNITYPNVFKDVSNILVGNYGPESYTSPSGVTSNYSFAWQTHRVTDAFITGRHTAYAYSWADGDGGTAPYIITATMPNGGIYSARSEKFNYQYSNTVLNDFTYFYLDQPSMFTDENGRITKYEYNNDDTAYRADNRSLKRVITPEATYSGSTLTGGYTEYGYDSRRNVTSISIYPKGGGTPLVSSYEYEASCSSTTYIYCNKVKKFTDPRGSVTDYTYSPDHGGVLTETGPADVNGVRPQTRYHYDPIYPKVLNSSGVLVNANSPIYKLTRVSKCVIATAADPASCVGTADELVTVYEYNNNNLLLTADTTMAGNANTAQPASGTNLWVKTSYGYDMVGNRVSVDGPRTDVDDKSYTTFDNRRRPIFEIGTDPDGSGVLKRIVIKHHYDQDGREDLTQTGTGSTIMFDSYGIPTDISDFVVASFKRNTYDPTSGLLTKTEVGQP